MDARRLIDIISKLNASLDEHKDEMPKELYKEFEKQTHSLMLLTLEAIRARYAEDTAQRALALMKKVNCEI